MLETSSIILMIYILATMILKTLILMIVLPFIRKELDENSNLEYKLCKT